jgi:hypothetical protein
LAVPAQLLALIISAGPTPVPGDQLREPSHRSLVFDGTATWTASSKLGISSECSVVMENAAVMSQPAAKPAAVPMEIEAS